MRRQRLVKKLLCVITTFVVLLSSAVTRAALLISEPFEGPNDFQYYDGSWKTIPNFANHNWQNAKYDLAKETNGCHSGSQCIRLYGEYTGGTSEFWTSQLSSQSELWITWWEKLSPSYDVNFGHKWFMVGFDDGNTSFYSWQSWDGFSDKNLESRVYSGGPVSCNGNETFAPTKGIIFPSNKWYQYKVHVKPNTLGNSNGIWQVWVKTDGVNWTKLWDLQNLSTMRCGSKTNMAFLRFGGTRQNSTGNSSLGTKWIDDIKIGTTEAAVDSGGGSGGGGGGSNSLVAPANLRIID